MDYALILLITACFGAGVAGSLVSTWALRRSVFSLQCDVTDLKDKVVVEVKRRAGEARQAKDRLLEEARQFATAAPTVQKNPWDF